MEECLFFFQPESRLSDRTTGNWTQQVKQNWCHFCAFYYCTIKESDSRTNKKKTKTNLHRKPLMQLKTGLSFLFFLSLSEFSFWKDKIKSRKKVYKWICNIFAFDRKKKRTWSKDKSEEKEDEIKHKIEERTERASKINCKRMV